MLFRLENDFGIAIPNTTQAYYHFTLTQMARIPQPIQQPGRVAPPAIKIKSTVVKSDTAPCRIPQPTPAVARRLAQAVYEANAVAKSGLRMIAAINECTVMDFCARREIDHIRLDDLCANRVLAGEFDKSAAFFTKLTNKVRIQLKKYAVTIADKDALTAFVAELAPGGSVYTIYERFGRFEGNETVARDQLLAQLEPKLKTLRKKYMPTDDVSDDQNGYIYMIRTRASVNADEHVYKIGKTHRTFNRRMSGYDKGYEVVVVVPVPMANVDTVETAVLKLATETFKQRIDYGIEYFEGDPMSLAHAVITQCV
jgi:hypothetical protein